jgi:hypothetical protein
MIKECPFCGSIRIVETLKGDKSICLACEYFFNTIDGKSKPTLFDRITQSPEVLAPQFVYHVTSFLDGIDKPKKIWYSVLIQGRFFDSETEAKRATVEKLKEVWK